MGKRKKLIIAACAVPVLLIGVYMLAGLYFGKRFFLNVTLNDMDVSGMTAEQVREALDDEGESYALHIETRGDKEEVIYGSDFGVKFRYDDILSELIGEQKPWRWGLNLFSSSEYVVPVFAEYDEEQLKNQIEALSCTDPKNMVEPKDAYIKFDADSEDGFCIVPEIQGSKINLKDFETQVADAVQNAKTRVSLEELNLYVKPKISSSDDELNKMYNMWKPYMDTKIVYHFDDMTEVLDASVFGEWMSEDSKGKISFDSEKIKEYVKGLAKKYNTAYSSKTLKTSYGETVTISSGPYGWLIDQTEETQALEEALLACESQDREPVYSITAASHTAPDYGDTYVEVNLSAQHLFFYKDGELLIETDFVSGNASRGWATPAGAYPLTYKQRNATLKGPGYATPVSYWMPFNGNIGLHDSKWRKSYGKNIYKTNGSHGCINLPPAAAEVIFENIEKGMPVLCYYLGGTEDKSEKPAELESNEIDEIIEAEPINVPAEIVAEEPSDAIVVPENPAVPDEAGVPDVPSESGDIIPDDTVLPPLPDAAEQPPLPEEAPLPDNTVLPE